MMMNKKLIMGLAAAGLLAACSNDEVVELAPQPQAIGFENVFVDNGVRADLVQSTLTNFFVFGSYTGSTTYDTPVFENTSVTWNDGSNSASYSPAIFWELQKNYSFGAYSNGNAQLTGTGGTVTFQTTTGNIKIAGYEVGEGETDLLVANRFQEPNASGKTTVAFTFQHALSKVDFKFEPKGMPDGWKVYITDLKITQPKIKADFTGADGNDGIGEWSNWADNTSTDVDFAGTGLSDITSQGGKSDAKYVIPQANDALKATVTVTVKDAESNQISQETYSNIALTSSSNTWKPSYHYTYTAAVQVKAPIVFSVTEIKAFTGEAKAPTLQ